MESHQERKELYELTSIRDESLHIQPYADMIDKLTYVQKADFAKRALELERDCATYKKMFEEVSRERNAWISEYRAAREEVERLKQERKQIIEENASQAMKISFLEPYKELYEYAIIDGTDLRQKLEQQEELLNREIGRSCALEEWLTEYRDDLKKDPNYRINRYYMIEAINELLNES